MKVYIDKGCQLQLDPLKVYFILPSKDYDEYSDVVRKFNRYKMLHRGIFKFRAIKRGDDLCHGLADELADELMRHNVIVRLLDDDKGNYNYALYNFNLHVKSLDEALERYLTSFIIRVCRYNLRNLRGLAQFYTGDSPEIMAMSARISSVANGLRKAIDIKYAKRIHIERADGLVVCPSCEGRPNNISIEREISKIAKKYNIEDSDGFANDLWNLRKSLLNGWGDNIPESDKYAWRDGGNSETTLIQDNFGGKDDWKNPRVTIKIDKVVSKTLKTGRQVLRWGVCIDVDSLTVPVYMGDVNATMIYIATLLKKKMDTCFYHKSLMQNINKDGNRNVNIYDESTRWLCALYDQINSSQTEFPDWYIKFRQSRYESSGNPLSVAKSHANKRLKEQLGKYLSDSNMAKFVFSCCELENQNAKTNDSNYVIGISPENINIPPVFSNLCTHRGFNSNEIEE